MPPRFIEVEKASQNNLKGASARVPLGAVTAVTGVAGAGNSSLAFDVLNAEGHRRHASDAAAESRYGEAHVHMLDSER